MSGTSKSVGATQIDASTGTGPAWHPPDERRVFQLVLATIWLFDGILQLQPVMFTRQFATGMLAPSAQGNPRAVAHSITWASHIIANHSVGTDAAFAAIQILLGLGIAWRPTVKVALAASIVWAGAVWWFGEGLGGVITGASSTVGGAPGAVLIYAVLAVLLWPADRAGPRPSFVAARAVGERAARMIWVVLWGGLAFFSLSGTNRSAGGLRDQVRALIPGEPRWLATLDGHVANVLGTRGLTVSVALAVVFCAIALSVFTPTTPARLLAGVAVALALVIWVFAQNFGEVFSGGATDLNTGPLLALFALSYWRRRPQSAPAPRTQLDLALEAV